MSRPGLLRLLRFGLPSLFATMLLCISVAGWWRYERQIDAKEQAAIDAMAKEGIGLRITRRSETNRAAGSNRSKAEQKPSGLLINAWDRLFRPRDPIVTLMAEQIPSDETRQKLLDVPQLERLWIFGNIYPKPGETPAKPPPLEQMLGRPLPQLPPTVPVADEPPSLPRGTVLGDEERKQVLEEIAAAWKAEMERSLDGTMLYVSSDDSRVPSRVTIGVGARRARLERWNSEFPNAYPSRIWLVGDDPSAAVQRRWETGKWRLEVAARSLDGKPVSGVLEDFPPEESHAFLGQLFGQEFMPEASIGPIERLEDGGFLLRRRKSAFVTVDRYSGELEEGTIVVGPAPSYTIRRSDVRMIASFVPGGMTRTDLFEYDDDAVNPLPMRQSTWLRQKTGDYTKRKSAPETVTKRLTRYGWEFDPELPPEFFSPTRGGDFFTSQPPPFFRWWYFTGAIAAAAYLGIGIVNMRRAFSKPATDAIAESEGGS